MLLLSPKPAANRVPESFLTAGAAALGHISKEHPESLQIAMRDSLAMRGIQRPKDMGRVFDSIPWEKRSSARSSFS